MPIFRFLRGHKISPKRREMSSQNRQRLSPYIDLYLSVESIKLIIWHHAYVYLHQRMHFKRKDTCRNTINNYNNVCVLKEKEK